LPLYISIDKIQKDEGGVKAHVLYDIEAQVPVFCMITPATKPNSAEIPLTLYEPNAYYMFNRAYDSHKREASRVIQACQILR
jgi:hypothetical protein